MNMNKTKIMVCDEQPFFRSGVAQALGVRDNLEVIECDPNEDPLAKVGSHPSRHRPLGL